MLNVTRHTRFSDFQYYIIAAFVGICSGLIGAFFHLFVEHLARWPHFIKLHVAEHHVLYVGFLIGAVMVVVSRFLVFKFCPEASGSGVQEIEGALVEKRELRWRLILPIKFLGGILSLSSGLVIGREGPTIHMGAAVAGGISEITKRPPLERRGLLAAGAAAGLAAAFNAPLAAILFIIEETRQQFPYTLKTYMGVMIAAAMGTVITEDMAGIGPFMKIDIYHTVPLNDLILFVILGVILGGLGVLFNRLMILSLNSADYVTKAISPYILPFIIGGSAGVLVFVFPAATGGGETLILQLVHSQHGLMISILMFLVGLRLFMVLASYATGVPGGIFAPILTLASCCGLLFGAVSQLIFQTPSYLSISFAIAAMGGLFSSSIRAPIVGAIVVLELTDAYNIMLPVLITCCVANIIADWLGGEPIYEQLLERTLRLSGSSQKTLNSIPHSHTGIV